MVEMLTDSASSQQTTMLVAPRMELCADRTETCKTLSQYRDEGMLSRSNVLWKFISGSTPHPVSGGLYVFNKVSNVSLVCEYPNNCQLECTLSGGQMCIFLFLQATNVSFSRFTIRYTVKTTHPITIQRQNILEYIPGMLNMVGNCTNRKQCSFINSTAGNRSWVFINCTNINIFGVHFIGPQNSWAVVRPRGRFTVKNCSFTELSSGLLEYDQYNTSNSQNHIIVVVDFFRRKEFKMGLMLIISNTRFEGVSYLPTISQKGSSYPVVYIRSKYQLKGSNVNITISGCVFKRCPAVEVDVLEDPGLDIKIDKCLIDGNVTKEFARKWLYDHQNVFNGSAVRLYVRNAYVNAKKRHTCAIVSPGFIESKSGIDITQNTITNVASGQGSAIVIYSSGSVNCSIRSVTIQKNTFEHNYGLYYRSVIYGKDYIIFQRKGSISNRQRQVHTAKGQYRIKLRSNTLRDNFKEARTDKRCVVYDRTFPNYIFELHMNEFNSKSRYNHLQSCFWQAVIYLTRYSHWRVLMENNTLQDNYEGGLKLYRSVVQLQKRNTIQNCGTYYGGGINMVGDSQLLMEENALLEVTNNRAYVIGGGFYIQNMCVLNRTFPDTCPCFFQLVHKNGTTLKRSPTHDLKRSVVLTGNIAGDGKMGTAGMIFNSNIDRCIFGTNFTHPGNSNESANIKVFREVFNLRTDQAYNSSEISSIPRKICKCGESGQIVTCDLKNHPPLEYYPGQRLKVNITILGDMDIHLSNVLYVDLEKSTYSNDTNVYVPLYLHSTNFLESKCNEIILPPLPMISDTRRYNYYLQLRVPLLRDTLVQETGTTYLTDFIRTSRYNNSDCPDGFEFNSKQNECQCHPRLREHGFECSLDDLVIKPPENTSTWLGRRSANSIPLIWSFRCPSVFCNHISQVPINDYDAQCRHSRTGILCGQCPEGHSTGFWVGSCVECTNWSLLYPLVLLIAGPLLIIIIGALNLTVTVGSINGIMYYVTIMAINLDVVPLVHFSTCLYNGPGINGFGEMLFRYIIPLYLLLLVGIACCLPRCRCINMHKINRKIGPRITPVLATVITIAYIYITFNVITSLQYATLYSTDGSTTVVWLFDGSLTYFQSPQHIILGCIAIIMFLLFILPAALTATFGDLLRRFIKGPWYINFLDTFHGAFRFRFGFWLGIQLLILTLMMILKVALQSQDQMVNLITVCMSTAILIFQIIVKPYIGIRIKECVTESIKEKYFSDRIQRNIANFLNDSYHFNIIVFFASRIYSRDSISKPLLISSIIVAYTEFILILIYHLLEYTPFGKFLIKQTERWYNKWKDGRAMKGSRQRNSETGLELQLADCWETDEYNNNDDDDNNHGNSDDNQTDDSHDDERSRLNGSNDTVLPLYRTEYNVQVPRNGHIESNPDLNIPLLV